jgi:hypothetical protein
MEEIPEMRKFTILFAVLLVGVFLVTPAIAGSHEKKKDDDNEFSVHGEVRVRGEYWSNFQDFNDDGRPTDSQDFYPYRFRLGAKGSLGKNVYVFGEIQSVGIWGLGQSVVLPGGIHYLFGPANGVADIELVSGLGENNTSFYQGWVAVKEVGGTPFSFKIGRRPVKVGNEFLLGDLDFYNGTVHDGVTLWWDWDNFSIAGIWNRHREDFNTIGCISGEPCGFGEEFDTIVGKATWEWETDTDLDVYAIMARDDGHLGWGTGTNPSPIVKTANFWTIGARASHWEKGDGVWNWSGEYALQTGDIGTVDKDAWAFEGWVSYMWETSTDVYHSVWLGYTTATGQDPTTADDESFAPLFQDFHHRLGVADQFVTSNVDAIEVGWQMAIREKNKWGAAYYTFTANEENGTGDDDYGAELDLFYKYKYSENLSYNVALGYFFTGDIPPPGISLPFLAGQPIVSTSSTSSSFSPGATTDDATRLYGQIQVKW